MACWTEPTITFDGRFWQLHGVEMEPKPVQKPFPPLWFGGGHPNALRRAARFGGFNSNQLILLTFAISGALAGLAGIIEVAGPVGHLQPGISPGYGFTAIIVAFLGRLNPIGILIAGLFLALTFIGGEQAQIAMKIPLDVTKVFQGILLFYVLACDSLILYRFRLISRQAAHGTG